MTYKVIGFGYNVDVAEKNFKSKDRAEKYLRSSVKKWCKNNDVDIDNLDDYDDFQGDYFYYGLEDYGVCIFKLYEVPEFNSKIEELLWNAKLCMDMAEFAAEDYKWSLMDCCVDGNLCEAKSLINEAMELIKKFELN